MAIKVIKGKEGFLFLDGDSNGVIDQITGKLSLTEEDLASWQEEIQLRKIHAAKHNYKYHYLIIPNKHCVYSEFLPENIKIDTSRSAIQLEKKFGDIFIYPLNLLRSVKDKILYHKTCTHWNRAGAAFVLNNILGSQFGTKIEYTIKNIEYCGDLGRKLIPQVTCPSLDIAYEPQHKCIYNNFIQNIGHVIITENQNANLPNAVIFGDSFFTDYYDLVAEFFGRMYYFHAPIIDFKLIERISPDIVLSENVERFIGSHPHPEHSFKKIVMDKFFYIDFNKRDQFGNIIADNDNVSDLDNELLFSYCQYMKPCKNNADFYSRKKRFILDHKLYQYLTTRERLFNGYLWIINHKQRFTGWATGFYYDGKEIPLGFSFILENLTQNNSFSINIFKFDQNIEKINPDSLQLYYEKHYNKEDLFIFSNQQEVYFATAELKLPQEEGYYLVAVAGDNLLGAGASYTMDPEIYIFRGYYRMIDSNIYCAIDGTDSLSMRVIYKPVMQ